MARRKVPRQASKIVVALAIFVVAAVCAGASWGASGYDAAADPYSMANVTLQTGVQSWWNAGYTGKGVDVAVIDSGVAPVEGLSAPGKVFYGPDLSLESQSPSLRNYDTYGHGTFMAGIIAGRDSTVTAPYSSAPASAYRGVAPDARIVSLKVGTADGGVDVSQVIAAIDWVVQHAHDPGFNIRVINLSYGTNTKQSYDVDPLAYAVEQAWKKGIVVVAAAGNTGYQRGKNAPGLADPAYDPYAIGVGGVDTQGTAKIDDDRVGSYSASSAGCAGTTCKDPDFVTVGSHLQGLRVPNSYTDVTHPEGLIDDRFFRGSGTSEATAFTSGVVALILQKFPNLTPDQVKRFLQDNARKLSGCDDNGQGKGEINFAGMVTKGQPGAFTQKFPNSSGRGSLELSRGSDHVTRDGVVLTGEQDIFGHPFDAAAIANSEASASSWSGGNWNGSTWSGSTWSASSWSASSWSASSWSGSSWSASSWSASTWSGSTWSSSSWSANSWSGSTWSGGTWSGGSWEGASWG